MAGNGPVTDNRDKPMPDTGTHRLEIRFLGTLEVWKDRAPLALGGGRQRALLALLALRPNEVVSSEWLIEELWEGRPPPTAAKALQNLIAQLRRALGEDQRVLITGPQGYELRLGSDAIDARRFERATAEGLALVESDPSAAGRRLRDALALWRGEPLADFAYSSFAQSEIARLQELRLSALEGRIDADLACGQDAELVPEAEALVAAHPLRERLRGQLMLALYRAGRQAEALDEYREARTLLRDELGLEPGPRAEAARTGHPGPGSVARAGPQAATARAPAQGRRAWIAPRSGDRRSRRRRRRGTRARAGRGSDRRSRLARHDRLAHERDRRCSACRKTAWACRGRRSVRRRVEREGQHVVTRRSWLGPGRDGGWLRDPQRSRLRR